MNTKIKFVSFALLSMLLAGCSHSIMRGSVAMKVSDSDAQVCLGNGEVKVGDRVSLFRNSCPASGKARVQMGLVCTKELRGQGTVTKLFNEHYSEVKFDDGVKFEEGSFVEKM